MSEHPQETAAHTEPLAAAAVAPAKAATKRFRARANYFIAHDLVWVRPAKLPYWPAEVMESDEARNRVRARLLCAPPKELLDANLQSEQHIAARALRQQQAVKREWCAEAESEKQERRPQKAARNNGKHTAQVKGTSQDDRTPPRPPPAEADIVTASGSSVYFFDKLATVEELQACVEERLQRNSHDVTAYEAAFVRAVMHANSLVRTVLSPERLQPYAICGIGVVHSLMRHHIAAPRQPGTGTFEPQTAVIRLRSGLENAVRDLAGFEYIWVLFQFSYAAAFATGEGQAYVKHAQDHSSDGDTTASATAVMGASKTEVSTGDGGGAVGVDAGSHQPLAAVVGHTSALPWVNRQGMTRSQGFKTLIVPPRDEELRGVFATRSPHRPNFIGLSCVRLVRVQGLDVHIADHDLLHGTPVLDIKPYLPFCDAHPDARAGWVEELDRSGRGKGDHKVAEQQRQVDRVFVAPNDSGGENFAKRWS